MRFFTLFTTLALGAVSALAAPQPVEDMSHLLVRGGKKPDCPAMYDDYNKCCKDRDHEWGDWDLCEKDKELKKKVYDQCCKKNGLLAAVICVHEKILVDLLEKKCDLLEKIFGEKKDSCYGKKKDCDKYCPKGPY